MHRTTVEGGELEYEVRGRGEPVLLIGTGPFADSFLPLQSREELAGRFTLIRYHQRGQAGSERGIWPVSFAQHAADAAGLLDHLGIPTAHLAGHSTGALIALELAAERPERVGSLALLEPPLMGVPSAGAFIERIGPAVAAHAAGDRRAAMSEFLTVVSSLDWATCRRVVEKGVPGGVEQAIADADTFFGSYLPALGSWAFGRERASGITVPVLGIVGTRTERLFAEGHALLHDWLPQIEECRIDGVAHLLHLQRPEPVACALATFFTRHPILRRAPAEPTVRTPTVASA